VIGKHKVNVEGDGMEMDRRKNKRKKRMVDEDHMIDLYSN
jgi:hypothetical protein